MVILVHDNNVIIKVIKNNILLSKYSGIPIVKGIFKIASDCPDDIIYWIEHELFEQKNYTIIQNIKPFEIFSYTTSETLILRNEIGYVDFRSSFLNINKNVKFATWLLSSDVGTIYCKTLLIFKTVAKENNFDLFLAHLGRLALKCGVLPYSYPDLIPNKQSSLEKKPCSKTDLFRFVKKNYTFKNYIFLFLAFIYYDRTFPFIAFLQNLFVKKYGEFHKEVSELFSFAKTTTIKNFSYDVVIPTLGRANHLYNFLQDLNIQTVVPVKVIIIEQNSEAFALTELDYLYNEKWNFLIEHKLINQLGACNARNLAIDEIKSDWVFFADDDIRIEPHTIEKTVSFLINTKVEGASLASFRKGEHVDKNLNPFFWNEFSSGCSIVHSKYVINNYFDMKYEFGFGEDTDYGCKLRQNGCSVLYYNQVPVFHLKAPIGGFRTLIEKNWSLETLLPFPEPTVIKCQLENFNNFQFCGFKLFYILKGYKFKSQKKRFELSLKYANAIE